MSETTTAPPKGWVLCPLCRVEYREKVLERHMGSIACFRDQTWERQEEAKRQGLLPVGDLWRRIPESLMEWRDTAQQAGPMGRKRAFRAQRWAPAWVVELAQEQLIAKVPREQTVQAIEAEATARRGSGTDNDS